MATPKNTATVEDKGRTEQNQAEANDIRNEKEKVHEQHRAKEESKDVQEEEQAKDYTRIEFPLEKRFKLFLAHQLHSVLTKDLPMATAKQNLSVYFKNLPQADQEELLANNKATSLGNSVANTAASLVMDMPLLLSQVQRG